ncbi:recombination regulator RecX [Paucimonas lemoignei]|uniref:recombination regulator RecX n=1 Tax=Paucimonas lemoignei TaxID=29443 RepID=UPI001042CA3A|nr:recombination regulator RecX [Paucimonas lemoignei]
MAKLQLSLKGRALRYLSMREHSRLELGRKLARHAQEGEDVEAVLDALEAAKLLSQERFAESLVHRRAARFGNQRILTELQSHRIEDESISQIREQLSKDEAERARAILARKYHSPPADAAERAKRMRFLQQRGFSHDAIRAAIRAQETDDE